MVEIKNCRNYNNFISNLFFICLICSLGFYLNVNF